MHLLNLWDCHKSIIAAGCTTFTNAINSQCSDVSTMNIILLCTHVNSCQVCWSGMKQMVIKLSNTVYVNSQINHAI